MRTRAEIEDHMKRVPTATGTEWTGIVVELLLDIRDLTLRQLSFRERIAIIMREK